MMAILCYVTGHITGKNEGEVLKVEAARLRQDAEHTRRSTDKLKRDTDQQIEKVKKKQKAADKTLDTAIRQEALTDLRFAEDDLQMVKAMRDAPIEKIINASIVLPIVYKNGEKEAEVEYRERRKGIVYYRARKWVEAKRFGISLLPIVERQYGLCGDLVRGQGKGCGCCLYCLPVTAVHLDHIKPQSLGGEDHPDNMQALCSSCNIKAGAIYPVNNEYPHEE